MNIKNYTFNIIMRNVNFEHLLSPDDYEMEVEITDEAGRDVATFVIDEDTYQADVKNAIEEYEKDLEGLAQTMRSIDDWRDDEVRPKVA